MTHVVIYTRTRTGIGTNTYTSTNKEGAISSKIPSHNKHSPCHTPANKTKGNWPPEHDTQHILSACEWKTEAEHLRIKGQGKQTQHNASMKNLTCCFDISQLQVLVERKQASLLPVPLLNVCKTPLEGIQKERRVPSCFFIFTGSSKKSHLTPPSCPFLLVIISISIVLNKQ